MSRFNRQQTFVYVSECGAELRESAAQTRDNKSTRDQNIVAVDLN